MDPSLAFSTRSSSSLSDSHSVCPTESTDYTFVSLDIDIKNLMLKRSNRNINKFFTGWKVEIVRLKAQYGEHIPDQLLIALCERLSKVMDLTEISGNKNCLCEQMEAKELDLILQLTETLQLSSHPELKSFRIKYLLFAVSIERRLGGPKEKVLAYYLDILLSSPDKRFNSESAESFRKFYNHFVKNEEPRFKKLIKEAIDKDRQIDQVTLPTLQSALKRIDQLENWGVKSKILIDYYQLMRQLLAPLRPQEGWRAESIKSIQQHIDHNLVRLDQEEQPKEGLTALEFQQKALHKYRADFSECVENANPKTPDEVRELQNQLFALFCTFYREEILGGPFMLLTPPFPEVDGKPCGTTCLLGSLSRKELSPRSDFEAFFLIKRERGALDSCLEQIEQRLDFLRHCKRDLRQFLESQLDYSQELRCSGKRSIAAFLQQIKQELRFRLELAIEANEEKKARFLKALMDRLGRRKEKNALSCFDQEFENALEHLRKEEDGQFHFHHVLREVTDFRKGDDHRRLREKGRGSSSSQHAGVSVNPHLEKPKREEKALAPHSQLELCILMSLKEKIKNSFKNCTLEAISEQRKAIKEAIKNLARERNISTKDSSILEPFAKQKLLREEEVESISSILSQPMKGADYIYFEEWVQYLNLSFFALGESVEGLQKLKFPNETGGIHLDIPDFDGSGIQGLYRSPEAFAGLHHSIKNDQFHTRGDQGTHPTYWLLKSLPLPEAPSDPKGKGAANAQIENSDDSLFGSYSKALREVLGQPAPDASTLRRSRVLTVLEFRLKSFEEREHFDPNGEIQIKTQFIEPLFHVIGDLGNFFGFEETNTLDIVDKLTDAGQLSEESRSLLKEAVADLYMMRIRNRDDYSLEEKKGKLQRIYWLVIFPLYAMLKSALRDSTASLEKVFVNNIDLLEVAFREAIAPEKSNWRKRPPPEEAFEQMCIAEQRQLYERSAHQDDQSKQELLPAELQRPPVDEKLQMREAVTPQGSQSKKQLVPAEEVAFQLAAYLVENGKRSIGVHRGYYKQLFSKRLGPSRKRYLEGVGNSGRLKQLLARHPNMYGEREIERLKREDLKSVLLEKVTTTHQEEWEGKVVEIKGTFSSGKRRYLRASVMAEIVTEEGKLKAYYTQDFTKGRVCRFYGDGCDLHFKQEPENVEQSPFDPGREHATSRLMMRLCGHGTSFSELLHFTVHLPGNRESKRYFVLASQTVTGDPLVRPHSQHVAAVPPQAHMESLQKSPKGKERESPLDALESSNRNSEEAQSSEAVAENVGPSNRHHLDPKRLTRMLLTIPILVPGDGRPVNYVVTETLDEIGNIVKELVSIDNDVYLGPPGAKKGLWDRFVCRLYTVLLIFYGNFRLETDAIDEFLELKPHLILLDWFSELADWNDKISHIFSDDSEDRTTFPQVLFDTAAGARLLVQMQKLQEVLRIARQNEEELTALDLLKHVVSYHNDKLVEISEKDLYFVYKKAHNIEDLKKSFGRNLSQSMTVSESRFVNYQHLPDVNGDFTYFPQNGIDEVWAFYSAGVWRSSKDPAHVRKGPQSCFNTYRSIPPRTQLMALKNFSSQAHPEIRLAFCDALDDAKLIKILKKSGPQLKILDVRHCPHITQAFLAELEHCPHIEELYISDCPKIHYFPNIAEFPNLGRGLTFSERPLLFPSLQRLHVAHCEGLTGLTLIAPRLQFLKADGNASLKTLSLYHGIDPNAQETLSLTELNLSGCNLLLGRDMNSLLKQAEKLTHLSLEGCTEVLDETCIEGIAQLKKLKELSIQECSQISNASLCKILKQLPEIRELKISGCIQIKEEALCNAIEKLDKLERLYLLDCPRISGERLSHLISNSQSLQSVYLTHLGFSNCINWDAATFARVIEKVHGVEILDLSSCPDLNNYRLSRAIQQIDTLEELHLPKWEKIAASHVVELLVRLTNLKILNIQRCTLQGAEVCEAIANHPTLNEVFLQELNLSNHCQLPEEVVMRALEKIASAQVIDISGRNWAIRKELILRLLQIHNLDAIYIDQLDLSYCQQSEQVNLIPTLANIRGVKHLNLSHSDRLEEGQLVDIVNGMVDLESLNLSESHQLQGETLAKALEKQPHLTTLNLSRCGQLREEVLAKALEKLPHLTSLNLSGCTQLQGELLIKALEKLTSLTTLNLSGCNQLQGELLAKGLEKLTSLTTLNLSRCTQLEGEQLAKALEKLTSLTTLDLSWCKWLQGEQLAKALEKLTALTTLNLSWCDQLEGEQLAKALEKLTSLTTLDLSWCKWLQGELLIKALEKLTSLTTLNLSGCNQLQGKLLAKGLEKLTSLTSLNLSGCDQLQGELLIKALEKLTSLTTLNLNGCTQLQEELLAKALEKLTSLTTLHLSGCRQLQGELLAKALEKLTSLTTLNLS